MNAKRRFRLSTVLRVAKIKEKHAQAALAADRRAEDAAAAEAEARRDRYDSRPPEEAAGAEEFVATRSAADLAAAAAEAAIEQRRRAEAKVEASRVGLLAEARSRKSLDNLRDRHESLQATIAARAAHKALDDLVRARRAPDSGATP